MRPNFAFLFGACCIIYTNGVKATKLKEVNFHKNQKYIAWVEDLFLRHSSRDVQLISAAVQDNVILGVPDSDVQLGCRFSLSPRTDDPVTLTLKRGPRLKLASRLASFTASLSNGAVYYGKSTIFDRNYKDRMIVSGNENMAFILKKFRKSDEGKYWCVVQIGDNFEYGTDARSLTLKSVTCRHQISNAHLLIMPTGIQGAIEGDTVVLKCRCGGEWCGDVTWFKGPHNEWANEFETIGQISSNAISSLHSTERAKNVKNRIYINGRLSSGCKSTSITEGRHIFTEFGLTIREVNVNDSGRYWCETTWVEPSEPRNERHWEIK